MIAENQKTATLARLRRWQIALDRYSCTNPTPSNAIDNPISHGRSGSTRTPRAPRLAAPAIDAMPSGRQQARVESALIIAATGAIFSECFMLLQAPWAK